MASKKHRKKIKKYYLQLHDKLEKENKKRELYISRTYGRFSKLNPYGPEH